METLEVACADAAVPVLACDQPCADVHYTVEAALPNVLLALDRSCSMEARWPSAVEALREVVTLRGTQVRWGLSVFPDRVLGQCQQGDILLPVGPRNEAAIPDMLGKALDPQDAMYPSGPCVTNLAAGIGQASTDAAFDEVGPHKVLILMTDGWNTCDGTDGAEGAIDLLRKLHEEKGISTYIISFGANVSEEALEEFALAGGTARDDGIAYYIAGENLAEIVDGIVGGLRCEYGLEIGARDVDRLDVRFDGAQPVPRDPYSGWTYDATRRTLSFHGAACDVLRARGTRVDFALGC